MVAGDASETHGVNDRVQLAAAEATYGAGMQRYRQTWWISISALLTAMALLSLVGISAPHAVETKVCEAGGGVTSHARAGVMKALAIVLFLI